MYEVECVAEGRTRILHRNLLLPLQGRIRQPGGLEVEDLQNPDEKEDEDNGMPGVTKVPQVRARRRNTTPQLGPTQHVNASVKDASADLKSKVLSDFRQLSDLLGGESSKEEELYMDSLTSNIIASDSTTIGNFSCSPDPTPSRVEDPSTVSQTESQFGSNMPYLEETTPSENTSTSNDASTEDSAFVRQSNDTTPSQTTSPAPPIPRRSTRSTKGKPPERYGQVYTIGTVISPNPECPKYRQTIHIPCNY